MRILVTLIFILSATAGNSQSQTQQDTLHGYSLDDLWDMSYNALDGTDTLRIRAYCNAFLDRARSKNDDWAKVNAYDYMTWAYPNLALEYNDSIIQLTKDSPRSHYPAQGYLGKANYYQQSWKPNDALREYAATMEVAKEQGCNDHIFQAKLGVASLRGQWGDHWKALELYKECLEYAEEVPDRISYHDMKNLYMDIALAYFDSKQHQEAAQFLRKGKDFVLANNDIDYYYKLLSIEGYNNVVDGRLLMGLDSLKKAAPHRTDRSFGINQYYQGRALMELGKTEEALDYFKKMDSLFGVNGDEYKELQQAYRLLLDPVRKEGNLEKVNELSTKAMYVDSVISQRSAVFRETAFKEYDLPEFLDQRTIFLKKLKQQKWIIWVILVLLFLSFLWGYNNRRKKLLFEERFRKIMESKVEYNHMSFTPTLEIKSSKNLINYNNKGSSDIPEKFDEDYIVNKKDNIDTFQGLSDITVEALLARLKRFENELGFLDSKVGLNSLAKELGTNHKYLSMVINENKGQDFRNYVKDLRVTHAINSIKENKEKVRSSVAQLAEDFGFKSPDSFARAFKWKTQMTPTKFMRKLTSDIS